MAFSLTKILKGLLIREENTLTPKEIEITPGGSASTKTTITSSQTADRTLTLPNATGTVVLNDNTATLTNKSIDADTNTITNIENADIKAGAAIDASKIANGSVSNAEFQQLDGLTSPAVGTTQSQTLTNKTIVVANNTVTTAASGNLTSTELNAALAELQGDIDTGASNLTAHLNDTVDAHDASAISNVPSGNLAATDVQSALDELQSDIDGRANRNLGNLTSPTAINQNLTPAVHNSISVGSNNEKYSNVWVDDSVKSNRYDIVASGAGNATSTGSLGSVATGPDGSAIGSAVTNLGTTRSGLITNNDTSADANPTRDIIIGTGNKTAGTGNSGSIKIRPGTSVGGTRGKILLEDGSLSTAAVGYVWTLDNTSTGQGSWNSPGGLPTQTGNAHKILKTDGTNASWTGAVGFIMTKTGGDNNGNSGVVSYSSNVHDSHSGVNLTAGTYTIQEPGDYFFTVKMEWTSAQGIAWLVVVDGTSPYPYGDSTATSVYSATTAYFPNLTAGQIVKVLSSTASIVNMTYFTLSGYKVR